MFLFLYDVTVCLLGGRQNGEEIGLSSFYEPVFILQYVRHLVATVAFLSFKKKKMFAVFLFYPPPTTMIINVETKRLFSCDVMVTSCDIEQMNDVVLCQIYLRI